MKERVGTESSSGSTDITSPGLSAGMAVVDVLLHQQSKALGSTDNSLSSANTTGDGGLLDASANATAASSPATLPLRFQQAQQGFHLEVEGSSCSSAINSQGASRASTLSLKKKKVNIAAAKKKLYSSGSSKRDVDSDLDLEAAQETTALNHLYNLQQGCNESMDSRTTTPADNYMTMSGTITRGKRAGQQAEVKVNISREELELIESTHAKLKAELEETSGQGNAQGENGGQNGRGCCRCDQGLHILILSVICFPFIFLAASVYSFYIGTLTWYNVFSYYTEEKQFLCRVLMAPMLIIVYPIYILLTTFGLGCYTAFSQITFRWFIWLSHAQDLEKGFYAYLCTLLKLDECSPYTTVVIVGQLDRVTTPGNAHQE